MKIYPSHRDQGVFIAEQRLHGRLLICESTCHAGAAAGLIAMMGDRREQVRNLRAGQ